MFKHNFKSAIQSLRQIGGGADVRWASAVVVVVAVDVAVESTGVVVGPRASQNLKT